MSLEYFYGWNTQMNDEYWQRCHISNQLNQPDSFLLELEHKIWDYQYRQNLKLINHTLLIAG